MRSELDERARVPDRWPRNGPAEGIEEADDPRRASWEAPANGVTVGSLPGGSAAGPVDAATARRECSTGDSRATAPLFATELSP